MRPVQIFISYRRDDAAGYARAICDELARQFGSDRVFIDVDDIGPGQAFDAAIHHAVGQSEVLLVLIGPRWLGERPGQRSRLHEPGDFVAREVAAALAKGMRVVPLLLDGTPMPGADQLPEPIRALATRNAMAIDNTRFATDMQRLVDQLRGWLGQSEPPAAAIARVARWHQRPAARAAVVLATVVLTGLIVVWALANLAPGARRADADPPPGPASSPGSTLASGPAATPSATSSATPGATAGSGTAPAAAARPAVNGRWQAEVRYDWPGARPDEIFEFSGNGQALQGTASFLRVPRAIAEGSVSGEQLRFETQSTEVLGDQTRTLVHRYQAELVDGQLRGTLHTSGGASAHLPVPFTATRAATSTATRSTPVASAP